MPLDIYLNVAAGGILAGLVYGLMALGLSVIFGMVRVVNFAHGEMMAIAMYLALFAFGLFGVDPLLMIVPCAAVLFGLGYALQGVLINRFITRPEHSQFLLMVAIAIIITNIQLTMVGLFDRFTPKFVKRYANCWDVICKAFADFQDEVHKGQFPLPEHSFTMKEDEYQAFLQKLGKN